MCEREFSVVDGKSPVPDSVESNVSEVMTFVPRTREALSRVSSRRGLSERWNDAKIERLSDILRSLRTLPQDLDYSKDNRYIDSERISKRFAEVLYSRAPEGSTIQSSEYSERLIDLQGILNNLTDLAWCF